jgi:LacI family transcriptional regulator
MLMKKATMKDVAEIVGISLTAVSMALKGHSRISLETRKKVLRIAKKLNYRPNFVARSLVIKRTHTIGLIITTVVNPFYAELAKAIEDKAKALGNNVILCNTDHDLKLEKSYINILLRKGVDGIILASVKADDPNIRPLIKERFPFILVNRRIMNRVLGKNIDYVVADNVSGGYMAMEHLYKLGHRRIGVIAGSLDSSNAAATTEGVTKFLKGCGLGVDPNLIVECNYSNELAYHAAKKLLSIETPPTALFAESDYMALGAREAILDSGLKIPEDVALVGFGNIAVSALKGIDITTISLNQHEMGSLAVEVLSERIEKRSPPMGKQIVLDPKIIIRNSCGFRTQKYPSEQLH